MFSQWHLSFEGKILIGIGAFGIMYLSLSHYFEQEKIKIKKDIDVNEKKKLMQGVITFLKQNPESQHDLVDLEKMKENQKKKMIDQELKQSDNRKIYKICITGGPCAGKTSGLAYISEKLREKGFNVFVVPEASTTIGTGGGMVNISNYSDEDVIKFQINLMRLQMTLEDTFEVIADLYVNRNQSAVILCDRGLMDGSAYMTQAQWQTMLSEYNLNEVKIRDKRYNSIIHLVTAADGALDYYNLDNQTRHESAELAKELDIRTQKAWVGHPYFIKIDNHQVSNFLEKLQMLYNKVASVVGLPSNIEKIQKKYLLDTGEQLYPTLPQSITILQFKITDTFLYKKNVTENFKIFEKLQKREKDQQTMFVWKSKDIENGKVTRSLKRQLTHKEYQLLLDHQDNQRIPVIKQRTCFMHNSMDVVIDTFVNIRQGFSILKYNRQENQVDFPDFLKILRDVSEEKGYKTRYLAKKHWYIPQGDEVIINYRKTSASLND